MKLDRTKKTRVRTAHTLSDTVEQRQPHKSKVQPKSQTCKSILANEAWQGFELNSLIERKIANKIYEPVQKILLH